MERDNLLDDYENVIRQNLLKRLEYLDYVEDCELLNMISDEIRNISSENYISIKKKKELSKSIFNSMRKLDVIQEYIDDATVTEIMVNGIHDIFVERKGHLFKLDCSFKTEEDLRNVIQQIVAKCNRVVNESNPIVDARLEDGSRVNVVLDTIALNGPILTIRRFPKKPYYMDDLIQLGSLDNDTALFLKKLVMSGYNIVVAGGTGSGKTTFLNALSAYIPSEERIITIEDSAELQILGTENLVRLETKNANIEGNKSITIRDLIKTSLRMRPDRIIVGEVRGQEAMDMICSAMNCGHDGSMSTVHANSAADTILRLETMILMAVDLPINAIRRQIFSGVDIIIFLSRMRDKSRKVVEIVELCNDGDFTINKLFVFREKNDSTSSKVFGSLEKIGELRNIEKIRNAGLG